MFYEIPPQVREIVAQTAQTPEWVTCKGAQRGTFKQNISAECLISHGVSRAGKSFYAFTIKKSDGVIRRIYFWGSPIKDGRSEIIAISRDESSPVSAEGECLVSDDKESMACKAADTAGNTVSVKTDGQ